MSLRYQQERALKITRDFLRDILSRDCYPRTKGDMRARASDCLKHYPMIIDGRPVFSQDEFSDREQEISKHPHY